MNKRWRPKLLSASFSILISERHQQSQQTKLPECMKSVDKHADANGRVWERGVWNTRTNKRPAASPCSRAAGKNDLNKWKEKKIKTRAKRSDYINSLKLKCLPNGSHANSSHKQANRRHTDRRKRTGQLDTKDAGCRMQDVGRGSCSWSWSWNWRYRWSWTIYI